MHVVVWLINHNIFDFFSATALFLICFIPLVPQQIDNVCLIMKAMAELKLFLFIYLFI